MSNIKDGNKITSAACIRFKKWLVTNHSNVSKFARDCGCSRQYIEQILAGKKKVTASVRATFKRGGYELL